MQPHFFPYIGYFYLIFSSDVFVYYDIAQFSHQSWQSRNRIRDSAGAVQYISVSVSRSCKFMPISDVMLSAGKYPDIDVALNELLRRIESHYRSSPHHSALKRYLSLVFREGKFTKLIDLNIRAIQVACSELSARIEKFPDFRLFSKVMSRVPDIMTHERVKRIAECASILHCTEYYTPVGSVEYMLSSSSLHDISSLKTTVLTSNQIRYQQHGLKGRILSGFEANLSILDLLANIGWDGIAECLLSRDCFELRDLATFLPHPNSPIVN
jgi:hypothetical protein